MITRRNFFQLSSAALLASSTPLWAKKHIPLGLQLYTVRDLYPKDLAGTLRRVRAIGYEEVELSSDLPTTYPAKTLRAMIDESGLRAPGGHFDYSDFSTKFDYAKEFGLQWMLVAVIPEPQSNTLDGFREAARQFNEWGRRARDMGMRFAFHNHDYEFRKMNGTTGYEVLLKETDPELVFFEMDCYWMAQAGNDPVQMLKRLNRRVRLLHLKDRKPGFPPSTDMGPKSAHFTEIGSGTLNWRAILAEAQAIGVEHYYVEQDHIDGDEYASIRKSYRYLRTIVA